MKFTKKDKIILSVCGVLIAIFFCARMGYVINQIKDMKQSEVIIKDYLGNIEKENHNSSLPTFYYFVSDEDEEIYKHSCALFDETKAKYSDKMNFELILMNDEILENLPFLEERTPAVILDTEEKIAGYYYRALDMRIMEEQAQKIIKAHEKQKARNS